MARGAVDICNNALRRLGQATIVALDEDTPQARLCNQIYDVIQDALLYLHPWNFAMKRTSLAVDSETPNHTFSYQYQLPTDCIRVWSCEAEDEYDYVWKIEGDKLLTDYTSANILYVYRNVDQTKYSSGFYDLFATRMAAELAYSISRDKVLQGNYWDLYNYKLAETRTFDGQEGTVDIIESTDLIDVR